MTFFGTISRTADKQGCIAGVRVYPRILTQDEITPLSTEFTPTDRE